MDTQNLPEYMKRPALQPRRLRIVGIGAGASGLLLAYKVQRNFINIDLTIFEKNEGVGGTWWENNYPGCACDNFSHTYTYSFEPKTDYEGTYSTSQEIQGLARYIQLSHAVTRCEWDEVSATWTVTTNDLRSGRSKRTVCDVLVNATGVLNSWKWPDVPGLDKFQGQLVHSAHWDPQVDLDQKTVGLVGNGSSGIQILPAILPQVNRVVHVIRSPAWVVTPFGNSMPRKFTEEEKNEFADHPETHLLLRKRIEATNNSFFQIFLKNTPECRAAKQKFTEQMREQLGSFDLANKLIPKWPLGCRRLTPGIGYLQALQDPKTELIYDALAEVTVAGLRTTSGREIPVDTIICATGFDTSFKPKYPVLGPKGQDLRDVWSDQPKGYLGLAVPEFPNYFTFLGPNCPIGNGPVLCAVEAQGDYICKFIYRMQTEDIRTVTPKMAAADEFMRFKDTFFQTTVWSEDCQSWYKLRHNNKISAVWTGSTIHYLRAVEHPRYEDWDYTYLYDNRWSFLGNGLAPDDVDPQADLAFYVRQFDDAPIIGSKKIYEGPWVANRGESAIGLKDTEYKEPEEVLSEPPPAGPRL
ncbi:putative sterigmatocystin biosynthesis monooxygenase stcW [Fonsecaea pedrosoi]|nr:putative sterigmatocystin biosynthesis monooxygenase stcW [Fonsecaea pedrosoi]